MCVTSSLWEIKFGFSLIYILSNTEEAAFL